MRNFISTILSTLLDSRVQPKSNPSTLGVKIPFVRPQVSIIGSKSQAQKTHTQKAFKGKAPVSVRGRPGRIENSQSNNYVCI